MIEHADRKSTRASVDLVPRYRTPESFDFVEGRCIDLSEGGMFITARLPCENGTLLKFECNVGGDADAAVKGVARVVWRRTGDGDRPSGMGLKFVKLEPGSPEVINQLVSDAKEHGMTAPEAPLAAQVRVTESFVPEERLAPAVAVGDTNTELAVELPRPAVVAKSEPPVAASVPTVSERVASSPSVAPLAVSATNLTPVRSKSSSGNAIWIALAVAGALFVWLFLR